MPPKGAESQNPVFLPFVGRISMDQCAIDATAAPFLRVGDTVTVLGGRGRVSFAAAAARIGSIPYELLTSLSPRVPSVYTEK
jgi:alanine racemase